MWLKKLTLKNFQKHENLVLDFTLGVNILYGHSDAGKSCVRRAIGFVFFGDPRSDDTIRKEDTKQTSVTALLDNGTEVERVKSASINRYVVRVPEKTELIYDSIGAEIPEEVAQVLQVKNVDIDKLSLNLNIAEQVCLPFLNGPDFPATARLKLFNKLTGSDLLDVVQGNISKDILNINRELKSQKEVVVTNEPLIEKLEGQIKNKKQTADFVIEKMKSFNDKNRRLKALRDLATKIETNRTADNKVLNDLILIKEVEAGAIESLKSQITTLSTLKGLQEGLKRCVEGIEQAKTEIAQIKAPKLNRDGIQKSVEKLNTLIKTQRALLDAKAGLEAVQAQLSDIKLPEVDLTTTKANVDKIVRLGKISKAIADCGAKIKIAFEEWNELQNVIPKQEEDYKNILKESGTCPICKGKITEEHLNYVKF